MNIDAVRRAAAAVADAVTASLAADERALVLGGDCTVELGTVSGVLRHRGSTGLIYIDLDTDLNPPGASDGALDWTVVAHLLDLPGCSPELASLGPRSPMLAPSDVLFVGSGQIPDAERRTIEEHEIEMISLGEVKRDPAAAGDRAAAWAARFEQVVLHVDVDVLAYTSFPIAENVRREPGLELSELAVILEHLLPIPNWRAMTITEANPDHAPVAAEIFSRFIGMLVRAFAAAA